MVTFGLIATHRAVSGTKAPMPPTRSTARRTICRTWPAVRESVRAAGAARDASSEGTTPTRKDWAAAHEEKSRTSRMWAIRFRTALCGQKVREKE